MTFFGSGRGELSFGKVEVSLPKEREKGEMPAPSWYKPWQRKTDPSRFVLLLKVTPMEKGSFVAELRQTVGGAPIPEALVFLHGFKVPFAEAAERVTLYGSSNDRALRISKLVHGYPRAGESGENMALADGVDTIDSSQADTSLIGHSSYGSVRSILADISDLLKQGHPPDGRFGFQPREREKRRYWVYQP